MPFRNERGAITGAEGCMFFAMFLFAALLIGLLVVAFFRFREPPQNLPIGGPPPTGYVVPGAGDRLLVFSLQSSVFSRPKTEDQGLKIII